MDRENQGNMSSTESTTYIPSTFQQPLQAHQVDKLALELNKSDVQGIPIVLDCLINAKVHKFFPHFLRTSGPSRSSERYIRAGQLTAICVPLLTLLLLLLLLPVRGFLALLCFAMQCITECSTFLFFFLFVQGMDLVAPHP